MENKRTRGNFNVMCRLVGLVKPLAPVMVWPPFCLAWPAFFAPSLSPVLGAYALLDTHVAPRPSALGTVCFCCRFWP